MAETHLLQHVAAFAVALWWTGQWLFTRPASRWRFAVSAIAGVILWIYVSFTALKSVDASGGVTIQFVSVPLAYFSVFMAFVSVIGILLGLLLWTEEEVAAASQNLPESVRSGLDRE